MWKQTLGKPGETYIIGKRWVKKNIPKSKRVSKVLHEEEECSGAIYDIGHHYLPEEPSKLQQLWVCMSTGELLKKAPNMKTMPKPKLKKAKPKPLVTKPPKIVKKEIVPVDAEPIPTPEPVRLAVPAAPSINTLTPVSEVKGIGKAVYDKLSAANIKTIGDLISKHSQEIATLLGRKSDAQIKNWQENAKKMLLGDS